VNRILVIDDEDVIRMLVVEILESAGYDVTSAESAERALALLEKAEFDLVVSDVVMPGLSGLELLEAVRARHVEPGADARRGRARHQAVRALRSPVGGR
jgi:CheY-like chemotaxis protein